MNKSDSINELAAALCRAQSKIKGAAEDSTNPHFKSKYASLQAYIDSARNPLSENGLSVTQLLIDNNCEQMNLLTLETVLMHSSGQWISSTFSIPVTKQDAQGFGSACTYARRYAYAAIIGIAPIDDDGNMATEAAPVPTKTVTSGKLPATVIKSIQNAATVDELVNYVNSQSAYHDHGQFRQLAKDRKTELLKQQQPVTNGN